MCLILLQPCIISNTPLSLAMRYFVKNETANQADNGKEREKNYINFAIMSSGNYLHRFSTLL